MGQNKDRMVDGGGVEDGSDPCPPPHTINPNTPSRTKRENPFVLQAGSKHTSQEGKWTSTGQDSTGGRNLEMLSTMANARSFVLSSRDASSTIETAVSGQK